MGGATVTGFSVGGALVSGFLGGPHVMIMIGSSVVGSSVAGSAEKNEREKKQIDFTDECYPISQSTAPERCNS